MTQELTTRELKQRLRQLGEKANKKYPRLNHGGCCVYAAAVAEELQQKGVRVEVITIAYNDKVTPLGTIRTALVNNNRKTTDLYNWQSHGVSFGHVAVRFRIGGRWYTYDSDALLRGRKKFGQAEYRAHPGALTVEEAKAFASTPHGWNPSFDRGEIPALFELVKRELN